MKKKVVLLCLIGLFLLSGFSERVDAGVCVIDSNCNSDGNYCKDSETGEYRNYYCSWGWCYYSSGSTWDCNQYNSKGSWEYYCSGSTRRKHKKYYDNMCSGSGSCVYNTWWWTDDTYVETCAGGCSNGACTCKSDGSSCSNPGSSTAECCSGTCGYSGKCVSCVDQCDPSSYPSCSGSTKYECTKQSDGCYDKIGTSCNYGCANGVCKPNPCQGVTCNSYCSGDTKYYNGQCSNGNCNYNSYNCNNDNYYGDWEYYCSGNDRKKHRKYYDYDCSEGSCFYDSWSWSDDQKVETCAVGCSDGSCTCKADGQTCSTPGSSTAECCSGTCGYSGKCVSCVDECGPSGYPNCDGSVKKECNIQGDGCYDEIGTSCNYGCSNGACNTCKADGQTCSTPGSSTAECCSGNCQMDGKCGTDICTNGCLSEGSTRCIDSNTKQTCGDYDTDICLEWGNNIECDDGCVNNNCHHCNIPDGSSYSCDCNSDVECAKFGDYYCNQVSGPDACEPIIWQDDCSNHGEFFCENGDVYQCVSNGKKYEKKLTDACGINKFCDTQSVEGTGKCSIYPTHMDMWVDYAGIGVDVNKQPNDKLKLNIYSERGASANLQYDSSVFSGDCPNGLINLVAGENSCSLTVKGSAEKGKYKIVLNERFTIVNIIYYPSLVILTDSKKLNERFSSQPRGVNSLLSQAYQNAENDGVVYDLSQYYGEIGKSNPFNSFGSYNEKISQPYMTDNSYSAAVGEFVSSKCIDCSDVMVVGDDYVVPYYRRSIETVKKSWIFWEKKEIKNIYTDTPYSQKKVLPFSNYYEMFKINGKYDGKNVLVITPHDVTPEQRTQIDRLKKAFEDKRYNPDFTEMDGKDAYCVDERWFAEVKGKTVIIIGTEENNNAFKCMPFVAGDVNRDAAFMQPNVWDNDEYALVINTNDANVLGFFSKMVEDGNLVELKGESAYMFHIGVQYAGYAAMGVGVGALIVFSGGTAAPAVLLTAGVILDGIADATDVVDSCYVNQDGVGWCGAAIGFAAIPLVSSGPGKQVIRSFDDAVLNNRLMRMFENVDEFINKYFKRLRSSKSIGDEAFEQVAKTIEDNRYMAKGSARFIGDNLNKLDNMPFSQVDNARFIKSIGETDDALEIGESYIKDIKIKKRIPSGAPGIYDRTTKEIIIAEEYLDGAGKWVKQDADELIEITAKHELSHAKIHEILNLQEGDSVFEHITDFDKPDVELIARRFDELSTNKLLKNNLADNSNFVGKIKSVELDDVSDGLLNNLASGGEYDTLLQLKAEAHEFGDAALKNRIDSHIPVNLQNKFNLGDSDSLINRYIQGTSINEFGSPDEYLENMDSMVHEIKGLIQ